MSDTLTTAYSAALDGMQRTGPKPLQALAHVYGDIPNDDSQALRTHLDGAGPQDALRQQFAHALARWDHESTDAEWAERTENNTPERRAAIIARLGVDQETANLFALLFPVADISRLIVIADEWTEWRTPARRAEREFYWAHYRRYLEDKAWDPGAVAGLDSATEEVVRRLSDPTARTAYQAKGIVVGHVQSGKTANFTGVIAKAIDAGYRLIIVLTGTTNMLRAQTQRRLDMELCGRENLQTEISPHDTLGHEYQDDPEWKAGGFVVHGGRPYDSGYPDIIRLSNHAGDYKRLRQGFLALDFPKRERHLPLFDAANLYTSDARLVVAKKNSSVLSALVADLGRISDRLGEVPVLIIDDESDQASVNTTSPAKWKADSKERTAINRHIGQLLRMMVRAQYVGYTATPYANVFIDPSDVEDIFPRDFLVALPRPSGYMGAEDFHDFDQETPLEERTVATSKERAHVRFLSDEPEDGQLQEALDTFVLTGAIKAHRQRLGRASYKHHTMLVHEAMKTSAHRDTATLIQGLWTKSGYYTPGGLARLRKLYERDVLVVSRALEPGLPTPEDFDDLRQDIASALAMINPADRDASPVLVVNSDKDLERQQESLDFDKRNIWRILVGGNKLARGFTVEGLTVTYYRRATRQIDTLMQMGRWFGFRPAYRDLVRLYTTPDLHDMFAAACLDEEFLRDQLQRYSSLADGTRQITPRQIPPLIAQHRPDLKPTGRNKMWNAKLAEKRSPGRSLEPVAYSDKPAAMAHNTSKVWVPLLARLTEKTEFLTPGTGKTYQAQYAVVRPSDLVGALQKIRWLDDDTFQPDLEWLRGLSSEQLSAWIVYVPEQTGAGSRRTIGGQGPFSIFTRQRSRGGVGALRVASEERHRNAARRIAGLAIGEVPTDIDDAEATRLHHLAGPAPGAMIVYPTTVSKEIPGEPGGAIDPEVVTVAFHMVTPTSTAPRNGKLILWRTVDTDPRAIVVDANG
jgi:hypothetical protein